MWRVTVILMGLGAVAGINLSDADHHRLPRLFRMDDYGRCLSRPGALYCMGEFRIAPASSPHHMYDVLKEYSKSPSTFDRTLLHRGYCVSARCARAHHNHTSLADNAQRFEACAQKSAAPMKLSVRLEKLSYCRSPEDRLLEAKAAQHEDSTHQLLIKIVLSVLVLNVVGTFYDVMLGDDVKKSKLLTAWSMRSNWRRLLASYDDGDQRLSALNPVQGLRVVLLVIVMLAHAGNIHYMLYTYNPQFLEWMASHPLMMIVKNGASIVQVFVMLSSFLLSYNMLIYSKQQKLTLALMPKVIFSRISRISPVYIVVLLFAISWWPLMRDGPMWQLKVAQESAICARKFWSHVFFVNNYVEPDSHCLVQTWFLAADMQLYIIAAVVSLCIAQYKLNALPILRRMFVGTCVFNAVLAYIFEWKSLMYITTPDNLRTMFKGEASFPGVYTSAWGSLPACIAGLYIAHRHYYEEEEGKKQDFSWIFRFVCRWGVCLIFAWILAGNFIGDLKNPILTSALVGIERPGFTLLTATILYGFCKRVDTYTARFFSWHGFRVLGRMSLAALLLHWCVDMLVAAARPATIYTSLFDLFVDGIATWVYTYLLAIPLTVLLEMPAYRFAAALV